MSAPLQNIGAIQSRRMNSHAHPICRRHRWRVYLLDTNSLNPAIRCMTTAFIGPGACQKTITIDRLIRRVWNRFSIPKR